MQNNRRDTIATRAK